MRELIKKSKVLKYVLIGAGVVVFGSACCFSWYKGFRIGCRVTADESVQYIKDNYPDAYALIMQQMSQSN